MNLDQSDIDRWKELPLTQILFTVLINLDEQIKDRLLNANLLMQPKGELEMARAFGNRDIIHRVLNVELQDFLLEEEKTEDDNEETYSPPW